MLPAKTDVVVFQCRNPVHKHLQACVSGSAETKVSAADRCRGASVLTLQRLHSGAIFVHICIGACAGTHMPSVSLIGCSRAHCKPAHSYSLITRNHDPQHTICFMLQGSLRAVHTRPAC
eukprot:scaffold88062_cov24-Tisochrysis_lutea.AAC.1